MDGGIFVGIILQCGLCGSENYLCVLKYLLIILAIVAIIFAAVLRRLTEE